MATGESIPDNPTSLQIREHRAILETIIPDASEVFKCLYLQERYCPTLDSVFDSAWVQEGARRSSGQVQSSDGADVSDTERRFYVLYDMILQTQIPKGDYLVRIDDFVANPNGTGAGLGFGILFWSWFNDCVRHSSFAGIPAILDSMRSNETATISQIMKRFDAYNPLRGSKEERSAEISRKSKWREDAQQAAKNLKAKILEKLDETGGSLAFEELESFVSSELLAGKHGFDEISELGFQRLCSRLYAIHLAQEAEDAEGAEEAEDAEGEGDDGAEEAEDAEGAEGAEPAEGEEDDGDMAGGEDLNDMFENAFNVHAV